MTGHPGRSLDGHEPCVEREADREGRPEHCGSVGVTTWPVVVMVTVVALLGVVQGNAQRTVTDGTTEKPGPNSTSGRLSKVILTGTRCTTLT